MSQTVFYCIRKWLTDKTSISELFIGDDPTRECFVLEDKVRDVKIDKVTAIPAGTYEIVLSWSNRFNRVTPQLLNVPGFDGIRIHPGNFASNTEGCPLPGEKRGEDTVINSRLACTALNLKIMAAIRQGKAYWHVMNEPIEDRRTSTL
jgi:hypothetical protein